MKLTIIEEKEVEVKYLSLSVQVRFEDEDMPYDAPMRKGETWSATIDLDTHKIENWPQGETLSFDMKVVDNGTYRLLDKDHNIVTSIENDYIPGRLIPSWCGDYLTLDINDEGVITNWLKNPTLKDFEENLAIR